MDPHDQQAGTQPGKPQDAKRQLLAEIDEALGKLRAALEDAGAAEARGPEGQPPESEPVQGSSGEGGAPSHGEEQPPQQEARGDAPEGEGLEVEPGQQAQQGEEALQGEEGLPGEEEAGEQEQPEAVALFDGSPGSKERWKLVGSGQVEQRGAELQLRAGTDRGLTYYSDQRFGDFLLNARYRLAQPDAPASAAVRFLNPEEPVPDREDPATRHHYDNPAYVAAHTGLEVRLGSGLGGEPGTLVGIPIGDAPGNQRRAQPGQLKADDWNELEIEVQGADFTVRLNGAETARYTNTDAWRGRPAAAGPEGGFVGFLLGEAPRAGRHPAPTAHPPSGGPMVPGLGAVGRAAKAVGHATGPSADLVLREVEVVTRGAAPKTRQAERRRARKDLVALHEEVRATLARLKAKDKGLEGMLRKAYGYAVVPTVGRASLVLGGARGYGEVFEQGKPVGFTRLTQLTVGVQVGGQSFSQLIFFHTKEALEAFRRSPLGFSGNLSAVFIKGATGMANFKNVTAHAYSRGGMVIEASLGGQKFRFLKEDEALKALAQQREHRGAKARLAQAGHVAMGLAGKVGSKVARLLRKKGESKAGSKGDSE
jgi:lipid-binding SYLF domain-containing protein